MAKELVENYQSVGDYSSNPCLNGEAGMMDEEQDLCWEMFGA